MIDALKELGFSIDVDYVLHDSGIKWFSAEPQPTQEQLDAAAETAAINKKVAQINDKRAEKEFLPISYDGKLLDADADAIKNINGQILRLESKIALGQVVDTNTLFWRDAENATHIWTDVTEYLNWLRGLAIAIAERTSYLYYIAWQKKLDPLNADLEQGW